MNKLKLVRLCLLSVIVLSCIILIIPSLKMINNLTGRGVLHYENFTGDLVGYIMKTKYSGVKTNYEMISSMSKYQTVVLVVNIIISGVFGFGELKNKKFPLLWILFLIVSLMEINVLGTSKFYMILSLFPFFLSIVYKVLGGNRKPKVK